MKLKTVEEHYDANRPNGWCCYADRTREWRDFADRIFRAGQNEIADALREALNSAETSLPKLIEDVRELAKVAAQKPAEVADERHGRLERERFWSGQDHASWECMLPSDKARWIAYAKTINRPKVSPGQRLFEAMNKAYGWGILWSDCPVQQKLEAAAKSLGITECDA